MSNSSIKNLNNEEQKLIAKIRSHPKFVLETSNKIFSDFDLLRWIYAYKGDVEMAILKFIRHLRIRKIIGLDFIENLNESNGLDEMAEEYAPMEILGPVSNTDGRILLLEKSGRFNLEQMMKSIRYSSFMLNRFRLMERIMKEIRLSEEKAGKRQSAVLLLDLAGMNFHTGLISFITGPYRIMWGTLVEQYPSFLSAILCLNCTPAMRHLWNACTPFLGDEYKQKVYLLGQENEWREKLPLLELSIPLEAFPLDYGGKREFKIRDPKPFQTPILELSPKDLSELEELRIPAGEFLLKTYFLEKNERLQFFLSHERELTINILYSEKRKTIMREQITKLFELGEVEDLFEVYAGCERPGLAGIDCWNWHVPQTGFFHLIFGNEKAWILPVTLKFQIFRKQQNIDEKRFQLGLQPIPEEYLGNEV